MAPISGSWESSMRKPWRARGSSSTTSVVKGMDFHHFRLGDAGGHMIGNEHGDHRSAVFAILGGDSCRVAIELMKAQTRVRQSNSPAGSGARGRQSRSIVLYLHFQHAIHTRGSDLDFACG